MLSLIGYGLYRELGSIHFDSRSCAANTDLELQNVLEKAQKAELDMRACWKAEDSKLSVLDKVSRYVGGGKSQWSAERKFNNCYEAFCKNPNIAKTSIKIMYLGAWREDYCVSEAERMMQKIEYRYPPTKDASEERFFNYSERLSCLKNVEMDQYRRKQDSNWQDKDSIDLKVDALAGELLEKQIETGKQTLGILQGFLARNT